MILVIFSGRAQSGKDTAAEALESLSPRITSTSFAYTLKRIGSDVFGIKGCFGSNEEKNQLTHIKWASLPFSQVELVRLSRDRKDKVDLLEARLTVREFLQVFGTNICRFMDADCWVRACINHIQSMSAANDVVCLTDARFPSELNAFRSGSSFLKGTDIHKVIVVRFARNTLNLNHESESALDSYDFREAFGDHYIYIDNTNMTLEEKNRKVVEEIQRVLHGTP